MKKYTLVFGLALMALCAPTYAATLSLEGEGTQSSPYLIGTTTDWNTLASYMSTNSADMSGLYIQLTADLDFTDATYYPLGFDLLTYFDGHLDGNGKTIKGISVTADADYYGGVLVQTNYNSTISDLTVEGSITSAYQYTGGVVGKFYGTMTNVVSKMTVNASTSYAGGLLGGAYNATGTALTNCGFEGTISSSGTNFGGLVGYGGAGVTYENCYNKGNVIYTGTTEKCYAGGLIGRCYASTLTGCWNEGTVSATNEGSGCLGGLIAYAYAASSNKTSFVMENCYNTSDITGYLCNSGLIAFGANYVIMDMEGCYNTGNITSTATSGSTSYTAGISGAFFRSSTYRNCWNSGNITSGVNYTAGVLGNTVGSGSSSKVTTVTGCYNTGEIVGGTYTGGVVAYANSYVNIDSCYNLGNVTATSYHVAGIVAYANASCTISSCYNAGNVTTSISNAGGILGYTTATSTTVTDCFNVGNVATTNETQGSSMYSNGCAIGGIAGMSCANTSRVYSGGGITGVSRVGGIFGQVASTSSLSTTYFFGKINAPGDTCGNIIGSNTVYNLSSMKIGTYSDAFFLAANNAVADSITNDTVSVGLSYAELAKLDLGDGWTAGDNYTYPRLTTLADNDYAKAYAAAVVPADGDSYSSITTGFNVGTPDGVTWTASSGSVEIDGNNVTFSESFSGTLTMTATCGDVSVATELTCNVTVTGISDITDGGREVVEERFYNLAGAQVAEPEDGSKAIYIVVKTYSDGTTETVKEVR